MTSEGWGRTREDIVPLWSDAGLRSTKLVKVINAKTDPKLAAKALSGKLHRLSDDVQLAESFVFHDPTLKAFALVVPRELAHQVLSRRAALLQRLAKLEQDIPHYAAEATAVVGIDALRAYLTSKEDSGKAKPKTAPAKSSKQEKEIAKKEKLLKTKETEIAKAEKLVEKSRAELEAIDRELRQREQDLDQRFERLREREQARLSRAMPEPEDEPSMDAEPTRVVDSSTLEVRPEDLAQGFKDLATSKETYDEVDLDAVEEIDDSMMEDVEEVEDLDDAKVINLDLVEPIDDESLESVLLEEEDEEEIEDAIAAPEGLTDDPSAQMVAQQREDGPYLFARLQEGDDGNAFSENTELLVQYVAVEERPVVLLALTDFSEDRPYPRRAALDPRRDSDLELLETIRGGASIKVALYSPSGRYRRLIETSIGPRAANLSSILERAKRATGNLDAATALERALAAAPPVQMKGHPFVEADGAETAKEAVAALESLAKWGQPEKRDLAILALSIPRALVEDSFRRVLTDALRFGLALPEKLLSRAVSMGIANEPGELVLRSIDNFRATAQKREFSLAAIGKNWRALLAAADGLELSVDADAHEQAQRDIAEADGDSIHPPRSSDEDLTELDDETLLSMVDHPRRRLEVALELVSRGDEAHLRAVSLSMRKMTRDDLLPLLAAMLAKGESAADALIDGLGAKKTFVRHACALGLGQLGLRRSLGPLVQLLQTEPTDVWKEVAWVLGGFGTAPVRFLERAAKNPRGPEERIHQALAHLLRGNDKALEKVKTGDKRVAEAIAHAREAAPDAEAYAAAREAETPDSNVLAFSQAFHRELAK